MNDNSLVFFTETSYTVKNKIAEKNCGGAAVGKIIRRHFLRVMGAGTSALMMPGAEDTWQSYGYGWANASNTPLRMFKQYDHEGGIRVPMIVRWPGAVGGNGRITRQVCHVMDILPTVLEAAGVEYPATYDGRRIDPPDGRSMAPILRGQHRQGHDVLFWKYAHGCAVRQGKWKLVKMDKEPWELYDMQADPIELVNLAGKFLQRVAQLSALWEKCHATAGGMMRGIVKEFREIKVGRTLELTLMSKSGVSIVSGIELVLETF